MDERQKSVIYSAMAKVLAMVYIFISIVGVTKLIAYRSIVNCLFELLFIIAVPILVYLFARGKRKATFPMTIAGLEVKPDSTKKALIGRIRAYIRDSLPFAAVTALFLGVSDLWQAHRNGLSEGAEFSGVLGMIGSALVEFIVFFAVCFAVDYGMYEWKARKFMAQKRRKARRQKKIQAANR